MRYPKKTVRGARKIILDTGWDEVPIRFKAQGLAEVLRSQEGFKPAHLRWLDAQRLSIVQRLEIIAKDQSLTQEALSLHFEFLWKELHQWAQTPVSKTRWHMVIACSIRRREEVRASPKVRK